MPPELTVAVPVLLLLQVPPPTVLDRVIVPPTPTLVAPDIVPALVVAPITVTIWVAYAVPQVPEVAWLMVVVPTDKPVTTPPLLTVATPVLLDDHVPLSVEDSV